MPTLLVPNSNGEDNSPGWLLEKNDCHNPAGSPPGPGSGGKFCSDEGTMSVSGEGVISLAKPKDKKPPPETVAEAKTRILAGADEDAAAGRHRAAAIIRAHAQELAEAEAVTAQALAREGSTESRYSVKLPDGSRQYTPERMALHKEIIKKFWAAHLAKYGELPPDGLAEPTITFMAGMPGSGKSTSSPDLKNGRVVTIDGDALKELLPEYANGLGAAVVQAESAYLADELLDMAVRHRMNIVLDGTMKTSHKTGLPSEQDATLEDGAIGKMKELKELHGYRVEVRFVDASVDESIFSAVERFAKDYHAKGFGRYVPPKFIRSLADKTHGTKPRAAFENVKKHAPLDGWIHHPFRSKDVIGRGGTITEGGAGHSRVQLPRAHKQPPRSTLRRRVTA